MKHIQRKTVLLGSVLGVAVGLFAGALVLGERLSPPVSGLCFGAVSYTHLTLPTILLV